MKLTSDSIDGKYTGKNLKSFPNHKIDPKKKDKDYCIDVSETIYGLHLSNKTGIGLSTLGEFQRNRMYGNSMQPVEKYMPPSLTEGSRSNLNDSEYDTNNGDNKNAKREGWMNVNWEKIEIMPKIKMTMHGMYDDADHDIICSAIDETSGAEKEQRKYLSLLYKEFGLYIAELSAMMNLPDIQPEFIPENNAELEMFINAGGFKLPVEINIEKTIKHTFEYSDWYDIKQKILDDAIDVGVVALREYICPKTQKVKYEYVDPNPEVFVIQHSKQWDFKDAEYGGRLEWMKISELIEKGISKETLQSAAQEYIGVNGNPSSDWDNYYQNYDDNICRFSEFRVLVFHAEWKDFDSESKMIYTTVQGSPRVKEVKFNSQKATYNVTEAKIYECSWIVGTDVAYNYGLKKNQVYPARLSYIVRRLRTVPTTKILIPHIDSLNNIWFKFQNALSQLKVLGYAINWDMIDNLTLSGGEQLNQLEVLQMAMTIGILPFRSTRFDGQLNSSSNVPIHELPSGMGTVLQDLTNAFQLEYEKIELLTGINPLMMGSVAAPRTGKAVTEMAVTSSTNVTKPIIEMIMHLKGDAAKKTADTLNVLMKVNQTSRESYEKVIGKYGVECLRIASKYADYGINLEPKPTEEEWQQLNVDIEKALAVGRDGIPGLSIDTAIMIRSMRQNGYNLKQIYLLVRNEIRKERKRMFDEKQAMVQQQAQANQQTEAMKLQAAQEAQKFELVKLNTEYDRKIELELVKQRGMAGQSVLDNQLANQPVNNGMMGQPQPMMNNQPSGMQQV